MAAVGVDRDARALGASFYHICAWLYLFAHAFVPLPLCEEDLTRPVCSISISGLSKNAWYLVSMFVDFSKHSEGPSSRQ
jgi:hypothetical protein